MTMAYEDEILQPETVNKTWTWKNLRSCYVAVFFHPLPWDWYIRTNTEVEIYSVSWAIQIGFLSFEFYADIGNSSSGDWRSKFGLSYCEAWNRAKDVNYDSRFIKSSSKNGS